MTTITKAFELARAEDSLRPMIANGGLITDAAMIARGGPEGTIGMAASEER